ncbi:hypothetical protein [Pseudonocardia lacus]|uniref:hypothetical protein n=1 Tax=Pseudonocardia lacus TaxID=2835865 RepID=UPI001BDC702E|nr:hypothetical protein [Pseudonocardia lacus]
MTTAATAPSGERAAAHVLDGVQAPWSVGLGLVVVLLLLGWWWADRVDARRRRAAAPPPAPPVPGPPPGSRVLVDPPMVENDPVTAVTSGTAVVPLRDWLMHFHPTAANVWSEVTHEFFAAAMGDPRIASFFRTADLATLQTHFLAVLITVTSGGVTTDMVNRLRHQHEGVRNDRGEPINRVDLDRTTALLVGILRSKAVPEPTLDQVEVVLARLGEAIVPVRR